MKKCVDCGLVIPDDSAPYCSRCGSGNFVYVQNTQGGQPNQGGYQQNPNGGYQQGYGGQPPMQGRPQGQRPPMQGQPNQGQRPPMQGQRPPMQGGQPPMQGQRPPMQGRPQGQGQGQRPPMQGQRPPMQGQRPPMQGQPPMQGGRPPMQGGQQFDNPQPPAGKGPFKGKRKKQQEQPPVNPMMESNEPNYNAFNSNSDEVITFGEWIKFQLLLLIPFYNIFKIIRTAIGGPTIKRTFTNYVRAALVFGVVLTVLAFLLSFVIGGLMLSALAG